VPLQCLGDAAQVLADGGRAEPGTGVKQANGEVAGMVYLSDGGIGERTARTETAPRARCLLR
jgi:hypothetical protein